MSNTVSRATRGATLAALLIAVACAGGCGARAPSKPAPGSAAAPAKPGTLPAGVLLTVNGAAVTERDLELKVKNDMHGNALKPEFRDNVLQAVVRDELMAQEAERTGLADEPQYQAGLQAQKAQLDAYRRRELSARYLDQVVARAGGVPEAEARRFFEDNAAHLRTDLHLWQILARDEAAALQAKAALDAGKPFEEVALGVLGLPPGAGTPWDLGFVKWLTSPEPWRPVLEKLKPGETSGIIRGPRNRYWILRLVATREGPPPSFEALQPAIVEALKAPRMAKARDDAERELRARATLVARPQ